MLSYITTGEAAERMGVSVDTVKRAATKGQLRHLITPGGHYRIALEDVDAYLADRTEGGDAA